MADSTDLVLIHGWMGEPADWGSFCNALDPSFQPRRICLPGHGQRSGDPIPAWSDLIQSLSIEITEGRPWLVGYSLGGRICLDLAVREPERYAGLILLGARPGWGANSSVDERKRADETWAEAIRSDFPAMLQRWYRQALFADVASSPNFPALIQRRQGQDSENMAMSLCLWSPIHQKDHHDFLQSWECPRLWICGGQDKVYARLGRELKETGGCSACVEIEHAGHAVLWEKPQACAEAVKQFIMNQKEWI